MSTEVALPAFQALLLAGGKSSRIGEDKAFLQDSVGLPLYLLQRQQLLSLRPERLLLSARVGISYAWPPEDILYDNTPESGPLAAIEAVSRACSCGGICKAVPTLVLAVDLPYISTAWLSNMLKLSMLPGELTGSIGIVPTIDGQLEPLVALYPPSVLNLAAKRFQEGERAVHRVLREALSLGLMRAHEVPFSYRSTFQNLNTPQDVENWISCRR